MHEMYYTVRELEAEVPLEEYLTQYVDIPKFLAFCRACPNYGLAWSCPRLEFDPMTIWRRYPRMRLHARMIVPAEPGAEAAAALRVLHEEKDAYLDRLLAWEAEVPGSLALAAGSCTQCPRCTRSEGRPCQKPERLRYSIEALGGDVGGTAERYLGKPLLWIKNGVVPEYLILVGALLLPDGER